MATPSMNIEIRHKGNSIHMSTAGSSILAPLHMLVCLDSFKSDWFLVQTLDLFRVGGGHLLWGGKLPATNMALLQAQRPQDPSVLLHLLHSKLFALPTLSLKTSSYLCHYVPPSIK